MVKQSVQNVGGGRTLPYSRRTAASRLRIRGQIILSDIVLHQTHSHRIPHACACACVCFGVKEKEKMLLRVFPMHSYPQKPYFILTRLNSEDAAVNQMSLCLLRSAFSNLRSDSQMHQGLLMKTDSTSCGPFHI